MERGKTIVWPLPNTLKNGSRITITGTPKYSADKFSIKLQLGDSANSDVAFQFQPNFNLNVVSGNSKLDGVWGSEDVCTSCFPFACGIKFKVKIEVKSNAYSVDVNGKWLMDYQHRIGIEKVNDVILTGDCDFSDPEIQ